MTITLLERLNEVKKVITERRNKSYFHTGNKLELYGEPLLGEGYEFVMYPGTAEVVQYRIFKEGILRMDVHLGEEDSECSVTNTKPMTIDEFVNYISRDSKKESEVNINLERISQKLKIGSVK